MCYPKLTRNVHTQHKCSWGHLRPLQVEKILSPFRQWVQTTTFRVLRTTRVLRRNPVARQHTVAYQTLGAIPEQERRRLFNTRQTASRVLLVQPDPKQMCLSNRYTVWLVIGTMLWYYVVGFIFRSRTYCSPRSVECIF